MSYLVTLTSLRDNVIFHADTNSLYAFDELDELGRSGLCQLGDTVAYFDDGSHWLYLGWTWVQLHATNGGDIVQFSKGKRRVLAPKIGSFIRAQQTPISRSASQPCSIK